MSRNVQEWSRNGKGLWKCHGCGRTGLRQRNRHRSWPPPVKIPVLGDWRGAWNEVVGHALVSPIDAHLMRFKWRANKDGYVYRMTSENVNDEQGVRLRVRHYNLFLHRVILGLAPGDPLEGHHRDDNPWNNQRWNLEKTTRSENEKYKHYRNIRTKALPVQDAPPLPDTWREDRDVVLSVVAKLAKDSPANFAIESEILEEARQRKLTPERAREALRSLMLNNTLYAKAGRGTYSLL